MDARRGRRTIPGSSRTMSLESGPEQWWHLPGISEQRAASPAAAMAPFLRSRCGSTSSSRGEEPVAAAAAAAGKPCSDRKKPSCRRRASRFPAAAIRPPLVPRADRSRPIRRFWSDLAGPLLLLSEWAVRPTAVAEFVLSRFGTRRFRRILFFFLYSSCTVKLPKGQSFWLSKHQCI
jgi:hypothetical protein